MLAELEEEFGDSVGFLGLLVDYNTNRARAANYVSGHGVSFPTVSSATLGLELLLDMVRTGFVPTSIIIDTEGNLIGEQIVGAPRIGFTPYVQRALNQVRQNDYD